MEKHAISSSITGDMSMEVDVYNSHCPQDKDSTKESNCRSGTKTLNLHFLVEKKARKYKLFGKNQKQEGKD